MSKMLKVIIVIFTLYSACSNADDLLTGDTKLACEAILCLSTSARPGECSASLSHFFGLRAKKPQDTINLRKGFLALCPVSDSPEMPSYEDLIANNAERCSAAQLNISLIETKVVSRCWRRASHNERTCVGIEYKRISNRLPDYCVAYFNDEYTDINLNYVGNNDWILSSQWGNSNHGYWKGY